MKTTKYLALLILSTIFFGINSSAGEVDMNLKTREAFSKQLNEWVLKNNPNLKKNLENKFQKNKEQILKHFGKRQINENILTTFSIFSQAVIKKQIKFQKVINKKELSINFEEDNLSLGVKFTY